MPEQFVPEYISDGALNWSITHISRFGDTDIYPIPFEYEAYKSVWLEVIKHLTACNLAEHELGPSIKMMIPKQSEGFRAAIQLDPYDCLLYTSLVYEMANTLENYRIDRLRKIACSYRLDINSDGQFFQKDSG
jgi:hypothetical protein